MKTENIPATLEAIGFSISILSGPTGEVHEEWPCIAYKVKLAYKGRSIIETDYSLGVGHAKVPKGEPSFAFFTESERSVIYALQRNPNAQLKDKALHASIASKLAKQQKVTPKLADVMHSLLSDGEAYFDAMSFEDWAANYGYDADSRKAESIFKKCDEIGRALARGIPAELLPKLREIVAEY